MKNKNIPKWILVLLLSGLGGYFIGNMGGISGLSVESEERLIKNTSYSNNQDIQQVGGIDFNKAFEPNSELENTYKNLAEKPVHHTVCIPVKKYNCNINNCKNDVPTVFNLIGGDRSEPQISRCDKNGCDTYAAVLNDSGSYKNIQPFDPKGFVFKMSYDSLDKKFAEIVTLGLDTNISYGYCRYVNEAIN